jgi:hypothetical protein
MEVVDDPVKWADSCFQAVNGRLPSSQSSGETDSMYRDLNLDGVEEHLEIRGVGNKLKQIYVFQKAGASFRYMGRLNAHPEFFVARDSSNHLVILNVYRAGANQGLPSTNRIHGWRIQGSPRRSNAVVSLTS